jgi:hypothetical protein
VQPVPQQVRLMGGQRMWCSGRGVWGIDSQQLWKSAEVMASRSWVFIPWLTLSWPAT